MSSSSAVLEVNRVSAVEVGVGRNTVGVSAP
jgi:hypothetical protein